MVRAGSAGVLVDEFLEKGIVSIGWTDIGELKATVTREDLREKISRLWPEWHPQKVAMSAGQILRFRTEISKGDMVITYDPTRRVYHIGEALGEYQFDASWDHDDAGNIQKVKWSGEVPRDLLSAKSRNSLGAISTLFKLPMEVSANLRSVMNGGAVDNATSSPDLVSDEATEDYLLADIQNKAGEFIKDKLSRLTWEEMQDLVAGVLRGMGYKTRVSPKGPDRGKDIIASPDGFGFENPRIVVEVKHRINSAMGANEIRSFLGGRHDGDKGLYVSTGGFSKDAYYEADRAKIPLVLMTLQELTQAILENYDKLDAKTKALIPLTRVYWPA